MAPLSLISSTDAGLPPNSYIYKIISTAPRQDPLTYSLTTQLASISSDDSLRFHTADLQPDGVVLNVNEKVTCLERTNDTPSNIVATAGRDGFIRFWDKRSKQKVLEITSPQKLISSLTVNTPLNTLAAGIENPEDGPTSSPVYIWDTRNPALPLRTYTDSHTDTVTSLALHPSHPSLLLSSSTDGLINIFDTTQADEDDALYQVINHGSAIAHAGFMLPGTDVYALGTDETASFYALQSLREEEEEPAPRVWGDVRERLGCDEGTLNVIPITKGADGPLDYGFDLEKNVLLPGAHGEEVVRDMFTDIHTHTTYTCGEDGQIRAWKGEADESMHVDEETERIEKSKDRMVKMKDRKERKKGDERDKARYKPY
ncbi:WD40 repeat-like protein [Decorospora gaudefroyi]|uniref:WD40 repeat-like protein n=1 Tax=Decorospora gaudefroyi TaxID=184978 RepID=A0A6A5K3C9_9PLEO|nr:WD40 repeat-like protein [Decorospora gaudefroyi]